MKDKTDIHLERIDNVLITESRSIHNIGLLNGKMGIAIFLFYYARDPGNEFKNTSPEYPEKKKALEKLANSLKETDNPVLMMVRLKM